MNISQNGLNLIKKWEGCYLTAYKDSVGVWTIGWGTTNYDKSITGTEIKSGLVISQATADEWLKKSVENKYVPLVNKYSKYNFNQNQFDALVSFCYNVGSIDQLTANGTRSISEIANHICAYCKAGGKTLQGLVNRRNDELSLYNKPCESQITKSIIDLAYEVIDGKWGTGEERKNNLGSLYDEVQAKVNEILKSQQLKSTEEIAKEVIDNKWGTGEDRKNRLEAAGYNYTIIQNRVNEMLKNNSYYPACNSKYSSLVDALDSIGVDSSFNNRKAIAQKNNVHDYTGTANQNNQLLSKLKTGRLKK